MGTPPCRQRCSLGDSLYTTSENLTSLLDDERFLLLVFEHLVDYGLKQCRLVCRKWREVSKHFPVEVKSRNDNQRRLIGAFPNMTSLTMLNHCRTMSDEELFRHLASLTYLKSLAFTASSVPLESSMKPYIQSMKKLTYLSITFCILGPNEDAIESIKYLTSLTKLVLRRTSWKLRMDPLVELQNIQALEIDLYNLFREGQTCMFPSLTNLTELALTVNLIEGEAPKHSLEEITLFADSLQSLSLHQGKHWTALDFTPLTSLTNLGTVDADVDCFRCQGFVHVLPRLCSLTKLQSHGCWFDTDLGTKEAIAQCSALKAFYCPDDSIGPFKLTSMSEISVGRIVAIFRTWRIYANPALSQANNVQGFTVESVARHKPFDLFLHEKNVNRNHLEG